MFDRVAAFVQEFARSVWITSAAMLGAVLVILLIAYWQGTIYIMPANGTVEVSYHVTDLVAWFWRIAFILATMVIFGLIISGGIVREKEGKK